MINILTGSTSFHHKFRRIVWNYDVTPRVITGVYLLMGFVGLYFSDYILPQYLSGSLLVELQAVKGGAEVLVSGGVIYLLTSHGRNQMNLTTERLERQQEELHVLHRVLRHNLRNDMNIVSGEAELVEDRVSDESLESHCAKIQATSQDIIGYIEKAGRIRRVSQVGTTVIDLNSLVPEIVRTHSLVDSSVSVTFDLAESVRIRANQLFDEALTELITNSIKFSDGDTVEIGISTDFDSLKNGYVVIEYTDNGPGIPDDAHEVLTHGEHSQLLHLDGMGLWLVNWVIAESDGYIELGEPNGTVIRMHLPLA